ncbi:hypothetical protein D3C75_785510 [compost metagenome]
MVRKPITINNVPAVNIGYLKARRFMTGCCIVSWRKIKNTSATIPAPSDSTTTGLPQPPSPSPTLLSPYTIPPKAIVDRRSDSTSILGLVIWPTFSILSSPTVRSIIRNGMSPQNIHCQLSLSTISPDTVGPSAGATIMTSPTIPMAVPLLAGGMIVNTVLKITGIRIAVPAAWTRRPTSRISNPGAKPAASVPAMNSVIAVVNSWRVVNHCSSSAETGIIILTTRI